MVVGQHCQNAKGRGNTLKFTFFCIFFSANGEWRRKLCKINVPADFQLAGDVSRTEGCGIVGLTYSIAVPKDFLVGGL